MDLKSILPLIPSMIEAKISIIDILKPFLKGHGYNIPQAMEKKIKEYEKDKKAKEIIALLKDFMAKERTPRLLKRYISIKGLFEILDTGYLPLCDPKRWEDDDKNDCAALQAFCRLKGEGTKARVLCFAEGEEVVHHWNTYSNKEDSCCLEFKDEFLKDLKGIGNKNLLSGFIDYKPLEEITRTNLKKLIAEGKTDAIPFIKRRPYECDKEYRVIWYGEGKKVPEKIRLKKGSIRGITLSPHIPDCVRREYQVEIKKRLEKHYGKEEINVKQAHIMKSEPLISIFNRL